MWTKSITAYVGNGVFSFNKNSGEPVEQTCQTQGPWPAIKHMSILTAPLLSPRESQAACTGYIGRATVRNSRLDALTRRVFGVIELFFQRSRDPSAFPRQVHPHAFFCDEDEQKPTQEWSPWCTPSLHIEGFYSTEPNHKH